MLSKRKAVASVVVFFVSLCFLGGCMNVRSSESLKEDNVSKGQFTNKSIAVLPVKEQMSLSTDSLLSLKVAVNDNINKEIKKKLPESKIIDTETSVNALNQSGQLNLLDNLFKIYESTGVVDKKTIDTLCSILHSEYIVFSRLKAEKMAVGFVGKGFGASLEVMIVGNANKDVVWGSSSEFKRGGMLGFGKTENKAAAEELVKLAFEKF